MSFRRLLTRTIFSLSPAFTQIVVVSAQQPPTPDSLLMRYHIPNTIPTLRRALKDPNLDIRQLASQLLAKSYKDENSIPLLRKALENEKVPHVRVAMAAALASLNDYKALDSLKVTCSDKDVIPTTRLIAAGWMLDGGRLECTKSVVDILTDNPDPPSRELGLQYLRRLPNRISVPSSLLAKLQPFLQDELRDFSPMNRRYAGECIFMFGDADSKLALREAVSSERDETTRVHLEESLKRSRLGRL
jgi:HEAT repeat protein